MIAPAIFKSPAGRWFKVAVCLILLDVLLFRVGVFWKLQPDFGRGLVAENWRYLFATAREFETWGAASEKTEVIGSSIVIFGVDEGLDERLGRDGVPPLARLVTHGSTATDSALLMWNSLPTHPWLVVYGTATRDYPKHQTDSGVVRIFYDSSVELPALPRSGAEAQLEATVQRYWKLYRYRFFSRSAVQTLARDLAVDLGLPQPSFAAPAPTFPPLPREAFRYFPLPRIMPRSWAAWDHWRHTRQFSDYLAWLRLSGGNTLAAYTSLTVAAYGPEDNPQVESLRWMLGTLQQYHTRALLVYFPENPVFRDPAARAYFDPALSSAYAELLAREAQAHGARFVDLRDLVQPEGFYDMVHLNLVGARTLSERLAEIIAEEWRARQQAGRGDDSGS